MVKIRRKVQGAASPAVMEDKPCFQVTPNRPLSFLSTADAFPNSLTVRIHLLFSQRTCNFKKSILHPEKTHILHGE